MIDTIIFIKKIIIIKAINFSIKKKRIVIVLLDNIKIRIIYSNIYQYYYIENPDLILEVIKP